MTIRSIDHLVLPTGHLDVARARFQALGFTVAPEGLHPFGTKNACVYLADDTFIEPLAIADPLLADAAVAAGNVFVARDRTFRASRGEDGFSAVVMATADADADHAAFHAAGVSAGMRLDFSRAYVDAAGRSKTVSFRLAFAAPTGVGDTFVFTCERVDAPVGGRGALADHANGVVGLSRIVGCARDPQAVEGLLSILVGRHPEAEDGGLSVAATNASISVLTPAALAARYRVAPQRDAELTLRGIVYRVADLGVTQRVLEASGIEFTRIDDLIIVGPADGQGAFFGFEETSS
ncbi:VOC family protein [Mesorhizobium sp. CAU 1741]|uniref:VOC family protein n=1 Tax=Mesorhizobium sp. CAU 1741 TaxID=3140366 RepID=UPI00325A6A10